MRAAECLVVQRFSSRRGKQHGLVTAVTELLPGNPYLTSARRELHPTVPTDPSRGHRRPTFIPVGRLPLFRLQRSHSKARSRSHRTLGPARGDGRHSIPDVIWNDACSACFFRTPETRNPSPRNLMNAPHAAWQTLSGDCRHSGLGARFMRFWAPSPECHSKFGV